MPSVSAVNTDRPFDFIVPFPYSSVAEYGPTGELQTRLSVMSQMAIDGAVAAWQTNGEAGSIILVGETGYDRPLASTGDLMQDYLLAAQVPIDNIVNLRQLADGTALNNTYLQAHAIGEFLAEYPSAQTLALGLAYHLPRMRRACRAYSVAAEYRSVEAALQAVDRLAAYAPQLASIRKLRFSEYVLRAITLLDAKGTLLTATTARRGARVMDVVLTPEGEPQLLKTTVPKLMQELTIVQL